MHACEDVNFWLEDQCARAFWDQHHAVPYQEMLQATAAWLNPQPGESWLDLGCGSGQLTRALWQLSGGKVERIVAVDCAAVNGEAIDKLSSRLAPSPRPGQVRFQQGNFSDGLPQFDAGSFDGIVSGLAISYAESRDPRTGRYTDEAYNRLLAEMHRVLKPGGKLVFTVNVPQPRFWRILWRSLRTAYRLSKPGRVLSNALKMQRYGRWLKNEAARGRFHFLPLEEIQRRLETAGFRHLEYRITYADQAYLVRARKRTAAVRAAA